MSLFKAIIDGVFKKSAQHLPPLLCPLHKEGLLLIVLFAVGTVVLFHVATFLGLLGICLTAWCVYFFRDPERMVPQGDGFVISPADGRLLPIIHVIPPAELGLEPKKHIRLSIFMNVFNVHVNRHPISGTLRHVSYSPGKFFNAALDKASEQNEHKSYVIETQKGLKVAFVQVAGLLARRIKSEGAVGEKVEMGTRMGIIRFGSRVDLYLPLEASIRVLEGQVIVAGETILAAFNEEPSAVGRWM